MKTALVTGGSRGIGRAVSIKLASEGYHVLINYLSNSEAADQTFETITKSGGSAELIPFNVSDREAIEKALERWMSSNPDTYIEVLINNAGIRRDNLHIFMDPGDRYQLEQFFLYH
jgi:3-oxoacyl-[acyl-carrier protein] reductase